MVTTEYLTFDHIDVSYLSTNLTITQLREEIRQANIRIKVCDAFDEHGIFPYEDYIDACQQAIQALQQRPAVSAETPVHGRRRIDVTALKEKRDIVAEVERHTQLRKSGRNFIGLCPLHDDHDPSFVVYPDNQTFKCYGCQRGGDIIEFIQAAENCDFQQAVAVLGAE